MFKISSSCAFSPFERPPDTSLPQPQEKAPLTTSDAQQAKELPQPSEESLDLQASSNEKTAESPQREELALIDALSSTVTSAAALPVFKNQLEKRTAFEKELRSKIAAANQTIAANANLPKQLKTLLENTVSDYQKALGFLESGTALLKVCAQNYSKNLENTQAHPNPSEKASLPVPEAIISSSNANMLKQPKVHEWTEDETIALLSYAKKHADGSLTLHKIISLARELPQFKARSHSGLKKRLARVTGTMEENHQFVYLRSHEERRTALVDATQKLIDTVNSNEAERDIKEIVHALQQKNLEGDDESIKSKISFITATALYSFAIGLARKDNSKLFVKTPLNHVHHIYDHLKNPESNMALDNVQPDVNITPHPCKINENYLELFARYAEAFQYDKCSAEDFIKQLLKDESLSKEIRGIATISRLWHMLGRTAIGNREFLYLQEHATEREALLAKMAALTNQKHDLKTVLRNFDGKICNQEMQLSTRTALYSLVTGLTSQEHTRLAAKSNLKRKKSNTPSTTAEPAKKPKT